MPQIHPKLSVVLLTCNRPEDLEMSIRSVLAQEIRPHEIVVVDDGNLEPAAVERLLVGSGVRLIYHRKDRRGIARSRNVGAELSSGELVMYLDDDERMEPGYIAAMLELFEKDREGAIVGAAGTRIGGAFSNPGRLGSLWNLLERFFLISGSGHRILPSGFASSDLYSIARTADVEFLGGTATYRRAVFDSFRFDEELERFGPYSFGEDLAFSYKINELGRRVVTPSANVAHHRSKLSRPASAQMARIRLYNSYYIYRRYLRQSRANPLAFSWAVIGSVVLSGLRFLSLPTAQKWENLKGNLSGAALVIRTAIGRKSWLGDDGNRQR